MMTEKTELKRPFQCTWPGCSNSYARSEHLNRHKLNRTSRKVPTEESFMLTTADEPVKIYQCEFCPKTFVRSDLLFRHKDRHARKASKRSPNETTRQIKLIRPARSDSASSREDAGFSQPQSSLTNLATSPRNYDSLSCSSYSSSVDGNLSRTLSHPRSLLQSPFSSHGSSGHMSSFSDYASRHRSNTLPVPMMNTPEHPGQVDRNLSDYQSVSPVLPPIRSFEDPKRRTYSVESMLNKPPGINDLSLSASAVQD